MVPLNFTFPSPAPTLAPNTSLTVFNFTGVTVPQAATTGTTAPTTGPSETATLTANQTNYVGTFSATTCTNAPPITVQPAASNPGQQNPASYTVTALAPGQCSIIVSDTLSHSSTILVNVPATLTATVT